MAENTGKTKGSMMAAISAGQSAVGSVLTGGAGGAGGQMSLPGFENLQSVNESILETNKQNAQNTSQFVDILKKMFQFDKDQFARNRDQSAELRKEGREGSARDMDSPIKKDELTGGLGALGLGAIAALALFAKEMGMNTDILKLPQQLKSIKGMATFAKGIGNLATLGLGGKLADDVKDALKATRLNPKVIGQQLDLFDDAVKTRNTSIFKTISDTYGKTIDNIADTFRNIKNSITNNKVVSTITKTFDEALKSLQATFRPITAIFVGKGGLFNSADGPLAKIFAKLGTFGKAVSKLFLPLTIILGIFDGVAGFMKEYEDTGSIVDGIRGAVVGIVDGFIGSFVRLITDLIGMALSFLGLDNLGTFISDMGEKLTGSFSDVVGGLVDFIMGIFTFDGERIWKGVKGVTGGVATFFLDLVTLPLNMAVNFLKDIFNFGDPDKPFNLIDFLLGPEGIVQSTWNWFKSLFTFDFSSIKQKLFDMGAIFKGLAAGGIAAAKAVLPGGESPGEAFRRVFESYTKGNEVDPEPKEPDLKEIEKVTTQDVAGNVAEVVYKTNTITNAGDMTDTGTTTVDASTKSNQNISSTTQNNYSGPMLVGVDSYHNFSSNYGNFDDPTIKIPG
tara:strand:- start:4817 stop:6676 length:1860 start_codon:yes stop_codon:yes gene_type:complete